MSRTTPCPDWYRRSDLELLRYAAGSRPWPLTSITSKRPVSASAWMVIVGTRVAGICAPVKPTWSTVLSVAEQAYAEMEDRSLRDCGRGGRLSFAQAASESKAASQPQYESRSVRATGRRYAKVRRTPLRTTCLCGSSCLTDSSSDQRSQERRRAKKHHSLAFREWLSMARSSLVQSRMRNSQFRKRSGRARARLLSPLRVRSRFRHTRPRHHRKV